MSYSNIADYTGGQRDYWSWAHLKTFIGQDEAVEHFYAGEASLGPLLRTCPYIPVPCSFCNINAVFVTVGRDAVNICTMP